MFRKIREKIEQHMHPKMRIAIDFLSVILMICGSFFILEYAAVAHIEGIDDILYHVMGIGPKNILLNLLTLAAVWNLLYAVSNRIMTANILLTVCSGVIAVINYYVTMLHGMPLSFLSLRNFTTAMNVISNYEIKIDFTVAKMLIVIAALVAVSIFSSFLGSPKKKASIKKIVLRDVALIVASVGIIYFGYFSENPVKPLKTLGWRWIEAYTKYGYTACTVESAYQMLYIANMPDGYSEDAVEAIEIEAPAEQEAQTPDIILILNETFYDLRQIADVQEDAPFLQEMESMENLLAGYAIVPGNGGGTNSAEYELLTSNSLQLMPGVTPFNTVNLSGANSVVSHLNALGYYTLGSHSEPAVNYSRKTGYQALQFQSIHFEGDFLDCGYYYDRYFETDESLYGNLTRWYEEAPADSPRFLYLLTIQNHGGYSMNAAEYDTVHGLADFGEYDDEVDEFLTSISLSDAAFKKLTEYFAEAERPVIICMMGDHSPSFAKEIVDGKYSEDESNLLLRKVPLVIWANFELEEQELGTMSMNYVVPTLLDIAGIQLSPYYQYMLQIKEQVPILTSYGDYYDSEGSLYRYDAENDPELDALADNYFYLEYHNLQKDRDQSLFDPYN